MVLKGLIGGVFLLYILWIEGLSFSVIMTGISLALPAIPAFYTLAFQVRGVRTVCVIHMYVCSCPVFVCSTICGVLM